MSDAPGPGGRDRLPFTRADIEQAVPRRFEAVVDRYPDRLALTGNGRRWTFHELNRRVNQLARAIRARVAPEPGVVVYLVDQSPEMVIASLAILKAGCACLAIHDRMPIPAQAEIVSDVVPDLIVTTGDLAGRAREITGGACAVLTLDDARANQDDTNPPAAGVPSGVATIVCTSGTDGRNKCVARSHRQLLHRAWLTGAIDGVTAGDRVSVLTHAAFGASEVDTFGALLHGASAHVCDLAACGFGAFRAWIEAESITVLHPPVWVFRRFLAALAPSDVCASVRLVALGGDVVVPADIDAWKRHFPSPSAIHYRFAATEMAIVAVARIAHDMATPAAIVDAGHAVPDVQISIVDEAGEAVGHGIAGEVVVTGAFLADGYWRRPAETAAVFEQMPGEPDLRRYRTGDLGRLLDDGRLMFLGRRDEQVKIRGFRVDTREVEATLLHLEEVAEAAVIPDREHDVPRLVAFVVPAPDCPWDATMLRARVSALLPDWKIPARFERIEALPLLLTGKVDRQQLAREVLTFRAGEAARATADHPADEIEALVADAYAELLHLPVVARHEDFFQLGGHSLLFADLQSHLEGELGQSVALEGMLEDATVAGVAALIRRQRAAPVVVPPGLERLVPLRTIGQRPPIFFVHGGRGQTIGSPRFLDAFGRSQPLYGFRLKGLGGTQAPFRRIADMAADYIGMMRQVRPDGPYAIGGICAGGLIAIEMAHQLAASGEVVAPMLLVDPSMPPQERSRLRQVGMRMGLTAATGLLPTEATRRVLAAFIRRQQLQRDGHLSAWIWFRLAAYRHRVQPYGGPVHLVGSRSRLGPAHRAVWRRYLTGDLQIRDVGGNHRDVFHPSNDLFPAEVRAYAEAVHAWFRARGADR